MTIKTISLAGEPGRPYLWHQVRKELLAQIAPGGFDFADFVRSEFGEIQSQLAELDNQTEFRLYNLLLVNEEEDISFRLG